MGSANSKIRNPYVRYKSNERVISFHEALVEFDQEITNTYKFNDFVNILRRCYETAYYEIPFSKACRNASIGDLYLVALYIRRAKMDTEFEKEACYRCDKDRGKETLERYFKIVQEEYLGRIKI